MVTPNKQIAKSETILTGPHRNYLMVRLETEDGVVGWGDATLNGRERSVEATLEHHMFPEIKGADATRVEDSWQQFFRHTYWRGGPVLNTALAGIDMALWDIKGKIADMPVYDLLGGRTRDYAEVYEHCGSAKTEEIIERCRDALDLGIDHLRINPSSDSSSYLETNRTVSTVESVREALGPEPELLVDVHGRLRPIESARLAKRLDPYDLFFLEDPVRPENTDAFDVVRNKTVTPLAMGELFSNPWEMLPLVENQRVDFIRTDLVHLGGITPARKLAAIGEHHYVDTAFHGPIDISPIGFAATVHVDLSVPNFGIQEMPEYMWPHDSYPEIDDVFSGGAQFLEGLGGVDVSDDPGLGISVDIESAREYSYERTPLPSPRHTDGSIMDW